MASLLRVFCRASHPYAAVRSWSRNAPAMLRSTPRPSVCQHCAPVFCFGRQRSDISHPNRSHSSRNNKQSSASRTNGGMTRKHLTVDIPSKFIFGFEGGQQATLQKQSQCRITLLSLPEHSTERTVLLLQGTEGQIRKAEDLLLKQARFHANKQKQSGDSRASSRGHPNRKQRGNQKRNRPKRPWVQFRIGSVPLVLGVKGRTVQDIQVKFGVRITAFEERVGKQRLAWCRVQATDEKAIAAAREHIEKLAPANSPSSGRRHNARNRAAGKSKKQMRAEKSRIDSVSDLIPKLAKDPIASIIQNVSRSSREFEWVRLRGFSVHATKHDVLSFMEGVPIEPKNVKAEYDKSYKPTGDWYVQISAYDLAPAFKRNMTVFGAKPIQMLTIKDLDVVTEKTNFPVLGGTPEKCIVLSNVPHEDTDELCAMRMRRFFRGYELDPVQDVSYFNSTNSNKSAVVRLSSRRDAMRAVRDKHMAVMGNHEVQVMPLN